ncbi:Gfo/Idh/MocA family protein [Pseudotamlana agarivorans]|uniref:Gfo/Idh/MocA family protein n=1 Tax=Pseudotamlana agarivorans TaxID=481183 RepID=UPI0020901EE2|nr:Gfo/Idh/MocA family oxidoreductase [Tamlana agarivorans]
MEQKTINWGIIGLGKIANKFATDLQTVPGAKLYAVASRTQEKANAFAEKFNATKSYDSYKSLVEDPNIDAVYIATPHTFHKENTLMSLDQGIAVLCEKPFAMNSEEVQEMVFKAKEKNVLLMEALWTYFLPHYNYVLDLIENKTYGCFGPCKTRVIF